jgi:hypothetical protein
VSGVRNNFLANIQTAIKTKNSLNLPAKSWRITVGQFDGFFLSGVDLSRLWVVGLVASTRRHWEAAGDPTKMLSSSAAKSALSVVGRSFQGKGASSPTV